MATSTLRDGDIGEELAELGLTNLFGSLWTRPSLDRRSRSLVILGILIAQGAGDELQAHFRIGRVNGLTDTEIAEIIYHATGYAGYPAASAARPAARAPSPHPQRCKETSADDPERSLGLARRGYAADGADGGVCVALPVTDRPAQRSWLASTGPTTSDRCS